MITALGVMTHILPQDFSRFIHEIDCVATDSAVVVIAQTPLPWRLFFARRASFETTRMDRALIGCYNLLQKTLGLDERRGMYQPHEVQENLASYGFVAQYHLVRDLAVFIASR